MTNEVEQALLLKVLTTMIREDVAGLRSRGTVIELPDGPWLRLTAADAARSVLVPVQADGFQCDLVARHPVLRTLPEDRELRAGPEILAALTSFADPEDHSGFTAFAVEYQDALAALHLRDAARGRVVEQLVAQRGHDCGRWEGLTAAPAFDALAAHTDHPFYPTSAGRAGISADQLSRHAPEFAPRFVLRWIVVPRRAVTGGGPAVETWLDGQWPRPSELGLTGLDASHLALPVHPLTAGTPLRHALCATGLDQETILADRAHLIAAPTLSMRTVALAAYPDTHLKLPLATSTLGRLNRRTMKPGSLVDGAATQRLLETVLAREPEFQGRILHADETRFAHAGHEMLAVLVRRLPAELNRSTVVPLAALHAPAPDGRLVVEHLADRWFGGDRRRLLDAMLTLLLDWQTTLLGYGIALESHQQNISLVLDDAGPGGAPRVRLLFKDDDGPRIHRARLRAALGPAAPEPAEFDDPRIFVDDDGPVLDLFTTITLHLCAGAFAYGFGKDGDIFDQTLLDLVRARLDQAARRLGERPGEPGAALRARTLQARHLPVKAMVTAGTLQTKERSGARDINKHYITGPNYLRREQR